MKLVNLKRKKRSLLSVAVLLAFLVASGIGEPNVSYARKEAEEERTIHGDVTLEDLRFGFPALFGRSKAAIISEPEVELHKEAEWVDIEEGYADLTITERDTAAKANVPADYIFILDRTRTMSLNESTFDGGSGIATYQMSNSPCINPKHYYCKGDIYLRLKDYFTGYDYINNVWFEDLPSNAEFWNRHYDSEGQKIMPIYENGCQDRLTMAKQAILELLDKVEEENAGIPDGAVKSRIAFWSFGDSFFRATGDQRELGLYNYVPWTSDYNQVRSAVHDVKTYSGTYYLESLKEAYRMITERNATDPKHKDIYTKIVFLSDGECSTDVDQVLAYADQLKALPNTELYTLAIGMTADSSGTKLLQQMASDNNHTASFWQSLSFDGGKGSALAESLLEINAQGAEVLAKKKTLIDQIETKYWDLVEVIEASGGKESVQLDRKNGKLTWQLPDGAEETFTCTVRLKLKDEYRYLLSDTSYPTNRDEKDADESAIALDPTKAGAVVSYMIKGGPYDGQERKQGVITPYLKYGTVTVDGKKIWTIEGSEGKEVTVCLERKIPGDQQFKEVNRQKTSSEEQWNYRFEVRKSSDGTRYPLIKYDEKGDPVSYQVREEKIPYYINVGSVIEGEQMLKSAVYNEPYKVKARIKKVDSETGKPLSGAEFSVYAWSKEQGTYVPYNSCANPDEGTYGAGMIIIGKECMTFLESEKGEYHTSGWLYYTPDNQGKFCVKETKAPKGYYGDWDGDGKKQYELRIPSQESANGSTIDIYNEENAFFSNERVKGRITFQKMDKDTRSIRSQGQASLGGAIYRLYAAEDIIHGDGTTGILYKKDEEIKVSKISAGSDGHNRYIWDLSGQDVLTVGKDLKVSIEGLELGHYYLKEDSAGEGYLINPKEQEFSLFYQDEETPVVEINDFPVWDEVKKQSLTFYKVTGSEHTGTLQGLEGAGFTVYPLWQLEDGAWKDLKDEEIVQTIVDHYRNPETLEYEGIIGKQKAILYENGEASEIPELFSDENGVVTTPELPFGTYVVVETTVPKDKLSVKPFVIHIKGDDQDNEVEGDGLGSPLNDHMILRDKPITALVRIEKLDGISKNVVLKPGASYVIRDISGAWFEHYTEDMTTMQMLEYKVKYGNLVVQYSQGMVFGTLDNPFVTRVVSGGSEGEGSVYVQTPEALPAGVYELQEVAAPEGYVLQGKEGVIAKNKTSTVQNRTFYETEETGRWEETPQGKTKFVVSSQEAVYDKKANAYVVKAKQQNTPAIGKLSIYAEGEYLTSVIPAENLMPVGKNQKMYGFRYSMLPMEGVEFEIRAYEDIVSPEGGENSRILYRAGEVVCKLVTNEHGQAWTGQEDWDETDIAKGLPLGRYTVTLIKAAEGFVLNQEVTEPRKIEITYAGQEVPVIYRDTVYSFARQKICPEIVKRDSKTGELLEGAVFGLYAGTDISNDKGNKVIEAHTLLEIGTSDETGSIMFSGDLPKGSYYAKEIKSPAGYKTPDKSMKETWEAADFEEDMGGGVRILWNCSNEPEEKPNQAVAVERVDTGDSNPDLGLLWMLGLAAACGTGVGYWNYKKKR